MTSKIPPNNPLIRPSEEELRNARGARRQVCPKCESTDFGGRKVMGVITFTCRQCNNAWTGGLPREPIDTSKPLPPENPLNKPPIELTKDRNGLIQETRRAVSLTQEFRKGALVPSPEEEDV